MEIQPGDVFSTYADVSKLADELKYKPNITIEKGIFEFIKWYLNYYNIEV